jgi:MFS family permease
VVLLVPFTRREHSIDYLGSALLVAAVCCLLLVTVWGGSEYEWWSAPIIGLTLSGLALLVAFVWQEGRAKEPVLPLRLFRNQVFTVSTAGSFIVGFGMYGAIIYIPLYLEIVNDATPTQAGLQLIPLMLGLVAGSVGSGRIITRTGHYKPFPIIGMALMATGMFLLSLLDADSTRATQAVFMVVTGLGVGLVMQVLVLATQNAVEQRDLGTATSATSFFRSMGGAFGVAAFGSVFNGRLEAYLADSLPAGMTVDRASIQAGPAALHRLAPETLAVVIDAFARALHVMFLVGVPVAVAGFIVMLFLPERPLRESAHVGLEAVEEDLGVAFESGIDPGSAPELLRPAQPPAGSTE